MLEDEYSILTKTWWILPQWMQPRFIRVSYLRCFCRWLKSDLRFNCPLFRYRAMKLMCGMEHLNIRPR